jgi:uncharacterized delta-60 repeat protein
MKAHQTTEAGMLDEGFGVNGIVRIGFEQYKISRIEGIKSVGEGPERKIYFAGWYHDDAVATSFYFLGRLNSDGSPDDTFGAEGEGVIEGSFKGLQSRVKSLAIQSDGKILLFGEASGSEFSDALALARYEANGTLDKSFGDNGYAAHNIILSPPAHAAPQDESQSAADSIASPFGVEILPDGKILVFKPHNFDFESSIGLIIRLDNKGWLDLSFNQIGYIVVVHPDYLSTHTQLMNIMVQADGKYLGCGAVWNDVDPHAAMFVRYDTLGNLDPLFGKGGFAITEAPLAINGLRVDLMAQQPNQRILGIGRTFTRPSKAMLLSIEPDGTPNIQFNRGEPLYTELESGAQTLWTGGAIQKNGRIVVVGGVGVANGEVDIVVARFIDEKFDPDFNGKGWVRTHVEPGTEAATGMSLQDDGKILVAAYTAGSNAGSKPIILRYLP